MADKNKESAQLPDLSDLRNADIVVGIPSFNNARTIGHVVQAAQAGMAKYFPNFKSVIVNSDGGSTDGTQEVVLSVRVDDSRLLLLSTPLFPVHRLSVPYHGIPGKGSAFRYIFQIAHRLNAKACALVDSDLRSITPEWFDLLLRPLLHADYDFVAPYFHRHKYDGTITNSIVYPLTRALYGKRVRQPIGGDFGVSDSLIARYLAQENWESEVARYGIDIWMTTIAIAEGYRVCQSFLGAKLHDAKDPGADLSAMLQQVVSSVFYLMADYEKRWMAVESSEEIDLFGFRFDVGLDSIEVNIERMVTLFQNGCLELGEIWSQSLQPSTQEEILRVGRKGNTIPMDRFNLPDDLWVKIIYDFANAYRIHPMQRGLLIRSLTPLYLGRVASFVNETRELYARQVEERIENLCQRFEAFKPYLSFLWKNQADKAEIFFEKNRQNNSSSVHTSESDMERKLC
jgi:glucosylglycerate synthase